MVGRILCHVRGIFIGIFGVLVRRLVMLVPMITVVWVDVVAGVVRVAI